MHPKGSEYFPGPWRELADLLRQTHDELSRAGAAGAREEDVVALSRAARQAVGRAEVDVVTAVRDVERLVLDARSLLARPG